MTQHGKNRAHEERMASYEKTMAVHIKAATSASEVVEYLTKTVMKSFLIDTSTLTRVKAQSTARRTGAYTTKPVPKMGTVSMLDMSRLKATSRPRFECKAARGG